MKIGFVLDDTLDSSDGVQQYVLTLGTWLAAQQHEVHYLVGETSRTDLANVHSLSRNTRVHFNGNRMSIPLPASGRRIKQLLRELNLDIIHIQMPYSPMMGAKVIRTAPAATARVGTFHILPFGRLQRWGSKLLCLWLRPSLQQLKMVFSVSQPAQQFAQSLGISSVVLPNVVDTQRFAGGKQLKRYKKQFTVVFLGRLVERKGCKEFLRAVQLLARDASIPNLKVVICGAGPQLEALQAWVSKNKLESIVEFVGFVSETEKIDYLHSADVAIFPSLGGESFGIVLIEAMAAGAGVVLGGNNAGYSSVLRDSPESIIDPRNTQETAAKIQQVYDDATFAKRLHGQQQKMVIEYDVATVGKKLVSYYKEVQS